MDALIPTPGARDWASRLAATGAPLAAYLAPWVDPADPDHRVADRSRLLCAGLAQLALACYRALGGSRQRAEVAAAAALLSLLTKIDDQVIDGPAFHGGRRTDRRELRERTTRYLAPTLQSLRQATPATAEPRCGLAAELGRRLRELADDGERLAELEATIARGWAIQVEAVATFTAHPGSVSEDQVAEVTANISGAWLLMISMVGTLPADASRVLTGDEQGAFFGYGGSIQRADALADLSRDVADGLVATVPGLRAWQGAGEVYLAACDRVDVDRLYEIAAATDADLACLPGTATLDTLDRRLADLGALPSLLRWIGGFLLSRYLVHPRCRRRPDDPRFAGLALATTDDNGQNPPPEPDSILGYANPPLPE
jgi:hypothetical protein